MKSPFSTPSLFLYILVAAKSTLVACDVNSKDLAPPSFHTGSVFHGFGDTFNETDYRSLNLREFDGMSATIYMAYGPWESPNATIYTAPWENVVKTLRANNKVIHGHILVYPNANLDLEWWQQQPDRLVEQRLRKYVTTVASARRGDIWIWDVVNEVLGDDGETNVDQDGVRMKLWNGRPIKEYQAMGQSYISKAFQWARAADPSALLLFTDYGCEEDNPSKNNEKSDKMFRLVQKLRSKKVPVDGVGMQFHFSSIPGEEPNYANIVRNFERFRNASIPIFITEMDVTSYRYNGTTPAKLPRKMLQQAAKQQALVYGRVMKICLNEPACKCLFMWDDAEYNSRKPDLIYSWLHPLQDGASTPIYYFPSPFWDINPKSFSPKPAWYAMQNALVNSTGVYRVASLWQTSTSYLNRIGPTSPSYQVGLTTLDKTSTSWTSMKWRFERVEIGIYRIACTWGRDTGYLSRSGQQDPKTKEYYPTSDVYVQDLHTDWWSQQWYVHYINDNKYKIWNRWGDNGTLTRLGTQDQHGIWQPTPIVYLDVDSNWTSQVWLLKRVWSAGDTKSVADGFWL